jgi:hypothetical protein
MYTASLENIKNEQKYRLVFFYLNILEIADNDRLTKIASNLHLQIQSDYKT